MNGNYYNTFPNNGINNNPFINQEQSNNQVPNRQLLTPYQESFNTNNIIDSEFYIENILRLNKGKKVNIHITIPGVEGLQDKTFEGIIEQVGKDHVIVSNPTTGEWNLILIIYIVYITFEEPVKYS